MAITKDNAAFGRRYVKGAGGRDFIERTRECARLPDDGDAEAAFHQVLSTVQVWEGMPQFENGLAIFREMRREFRARGLL